jgi:hypothetical protein
LLARILRQSRCTGAHQLERAFGLEDRRLGVAARRLHQILARLLDARGNLLQQLGQVGSALVRRARCGWFKCAADFTCGHVQRRIVFPHAARLRRVDRRFEQPDHQAAIDIFLARQASRLDLLDLGQQLASRVDFLLEAVERNIPQPARLVVLVLALEIGVLPDQGLQRHR